jgi:hypothetical protein
MKLSEIARYWAARALTHMSVDATHAVSIEAPIACPDFTVRFRRRPVKPPILQFGDQALRLRQVASPDLLAGATFWAEKEQMVACFNLPKGNSRLES